MVGIVILVVVTTFNLVNDFQRLVKEVRCKRKHILSVGFAIFICVSRNKRTSSIIWLGWMIVTMVYLKGLYYIMRPSKSKEKFDEFRDNYFDINNQVWLSMDYELIVKTIRNN